MSHLDMSEIAGRVVAVAQNTQRRHDDLHDCAADLFARLTEGIDDTSRNLIAFVIRRRLGVVLA